MSCGSNKKKYKCDGRHSASCTFYESDLPDDSSLKEESCVTTEETTKELYSWVSELRKSLDKKKIKGECIGFDNDNQDIFELLNILIEGRCDTIEGEDSQGDGNNKSISIFDIGLGNLDLSCVPSECSDKINTLGDLLKEIICKKCE